MIVATLAALASLAGAEFFVAPTGDDAAPGSRSAPFRTLARAQRAVRELKLSRGLPEGGATVFLMPGRHVLSETLVLGPDDSGEPGKPVVYRSLEPGKAVITSERAIEGWRRPAEDPPLAAPEARGRLWVAAIPAEWSFRSLFLSGKPLRRAAWPDLDSWRRWPTLRSVGATGELGTELQFRPGALEGMPVNGDGEVVLADPYGSFTSIGVLRQVDPVLSRANLASRNPVGVPTAEWRYRLENALPMLNEPGEWCVDSLRGRVYLWPPADVPRPAGATAPRLTTLVRMVGDPAKGRWVSNVRWSGVVFRGTDRTPENRWPDGWILPTSGTAEAAVALSGVEACSIEGCRFEDTGGWGLALEGRAIACRVVGNAFLRTGCGGVRLVAAGAATSRENGRHTVERNVFVRSGASGYWQSPGVLVYGSFGNRIALNRFERLPWAAVALMGPPLGALNGLAGETTDAYGVRRNRWGIRWPQLPPGSQQRRNEGQGAEAAGLSVTAQNVVEKNWIVEAMERLDTGGAIVAWSCGPGNVLRGNAIQSLVGTVANHPIWLDRGARGNSVEGNRVWAPGTLKDDGSGNTWRDNPISSARFSAFEGAVAAIRAEVERLGGWPAADGG